MKGMVRVSAVVKTTHAEVHLPVTAQASRGVTGLVFLCSGSVLCSPETSLFYYDKKFLWCVIISLRSRGKATLRQKSRHCYLRVIQNHLCEWLKPGDENSGSPPVVHFVARCFLHVRYRDRLSRVCLGRPLRFLRRVALAFEK